MANRGQIVTLSRALISQEDTENTDFTDAQLQGYADEGIRFLATIVKWPRKETTTQAVEDTATYAFSSDFVLLLNAYFGSTSVSGDVKPLRIITEEELKQQRPNYLDATTNSQGRPDTLIIKDRSNCLISPRPNAAESITGKKLILHHVYSPAALASDSESPDLPVSYHDLIPMYIQHKCYLGKLNNPELATAIMKQIFDKAKLLESVVVKEMEQLRMFWNSDDMRDDDSDVPGGIYFS